MKRHLIWIIAGTATVGLAVPAFAAVQSASPDDNGIPGEIRGNCDEAEHVNDPECLAVASSPTTPSTLGVPAATSPSMSASTTIGTPTTSPDVTVAQRVPTESTDDRSTGSIAPSTSVSASGPVGTVPGVMVPTSVPGDVSGPCDEAEHANDPRCTGSTPGDDSSSRGGDDDVSDDSSGRGGDDDVSDDSSGRGGDDSGSDDSSGRGDDSDDDSSGDDSDDDSSGDDSDDDNSGHGSDD